MVILQVEKEKYISGSPTVASSGDVEVNLDTQLLVTVLNKDLVDLFTVGSINAPEKLLLSPVW